MTGRDNSPQIRQWISRCEKIVRAQGWESGRYGSAAAWPLLWLRRVRENAPVLYLSAGIHGDEPAAVEALVSELESCPAWLEKFTILCCPILNPEGCAAATRCDESGRDLNRDYKKFLSPTTRAHRDWLDSQPHPELCLSLHEDWEASGFYLYEINTSHHPCIGAQILSQVASQFPLEESPVIDGHLATSRGYIHHPPEADLPEEWPEAIWLVRRSPCLSVTLETPSRDDFQKRVVMHKTAIKTALELFLCSLEKAKYRSIHSDRPGSR